MIGVRSPARGGHAAHLVLAGAAAAVSVAVGFQAAERTSQLLVALPIAVAGLILAVLAYTSFEAFVLTVLLIRTAVDWAHPVAGSSEGQSQSSLPATALAVLFMAASALWLVAQRRSGRRVPRSAAGTALLLLVGAGLLSVATSSNRAVTVTEVARIAAAATMFLVVEQLVAEPRSIPRVLVVCYASAIVPLSVAAYQAATGSGAVLVDGLSRVRGTFVHPNAFGFCLALLVVMGAAIYRHLRGPQRIALAVMMIAGSGGIVLSYSRESWLALIVGLLVVGVLQSPRSLLFLGMAAIALIVVSSSVQARLGDLEQGRTTRGTAGNSLVWRFDHWGDSLSLANRNPVTGIGLKMTQSETDSERAPHNDFIRVYVETGMLGMAVYLGLLVSLFNSTRRSLTGATPGLERGAAVGAAGCLAAFVLVSVGGNLISQVVVLWYVFALAAVGTAVAARQRGQAA
jgi:putative inorganic carbon (hco3(-)) transporter